MSTSSVAFVAAICVAISSVGGENITRVTDGSFARPGQFPSVVSIRNERKVHVCGGSLIDANLVLTAAHCVSNVFLEELICGLVHRGPLVILIPDVLSPTAGDILFGQLQGNESSLVAQLRLIFTSNSSGKAKFGFFADKTLRSDENTTMRDLGGYTIRIGLNNKLRFGESYNISQVSIHRYYNNQTMLNDLAILRTTTKVRMTVYTKTAKLPPRRFQVPTGAKVTLAGWELPGLTPERRRAEKTGVIGNQCTENNSHYLRFMQATIINNNKCSFDDFNALASNYCAIGAMGRDLCLSNAGGPMMYKGYLVGTLILAPSCDSNRPFIYMKTTLFLNWIEHVSIDLDVLAAMNG